MRYTIIAGATSSIGFAAARQLAAAGEHLVLIDRDEKESAKAASDLQVKYNIKAFTYHFDALADHSAEKLMQRILKAHGKPRQMLLFIGAMAPDGVRISEADVKRLVAVNFEAVIMLGNGFARHCAPNARLGVVTSVAGDRGKARTLVYGAAKGGVSTYLEGLRQSGRCSVTDIRPGFVDTPMTYGTVDSPLVASRERVARSLLRAVRKRKRKAYIPWFWRYLLLIIRLIPGKIYDKLSL